MSTEMKIGRKLTIGFTIIASLVGVVGMFSVMSHNTIQGDSKIAREVLELGILVDASLVELLALIQTEDIEEYATRKSAYEQIRAKFDGLAKQLGQQATEDLLALGFDIEGFNEDTDDLAKISNRLIALQKRKLRKSKRFDEKVTVINELAIDMRRVIGAVQNAELANSVSNMQYLAVVSLYQNKDKESSDEWLSFIEAFKNSAVRYSIFQEERNRLLSDLNDYGRIAQDLGRIITEEAIIEAQERVAWGELRELINLLAVNREKIVKKIKAESEALAKNTLLAMFAVSVGVLLASSILGLAISRSISKPISTLAHTAEAIAGGDLNKRAQVQSEDEVGQLARSFNYMLDELSSSKEYTDNIIKSMLDTLIVVDPDGKVKTINKATSDLLGYKKEDELIGQPARILFAEEERSPFKGTGLQKLIEAGSLQDYEMTYKTKSGQKIPVGFSGSVMRDKDGKLMGIVGVARDMRVTRQLIESEKELAAQEAVGAAERKRTAELESAQEASLNIMEDLERERKAVEERETQLKETQAMLVQAGKMAALGTLGAGIAHELNQPLTAIKGYTQVFLEELPPRDRRRKELKLIEGQTLRMAKIINNIRTFGREAKTSLEPVDIHKPIEDAFMLVTAQLKNHNIQVVRDYDRDVPKVLAESTQLQQVFINIITNAMDALDTHGGGKLWVKTGSGDREARRPSSVEVVFRNNGPLIPQSVIGLVFDPFFTTKEPGQGTGLGLSISYAIMKAHKGQIRAASTEGKGVEFVITLPVADDRHATKR